MRLKNLSALRGSVFVVDRGFIGYKHLFSWIKTGSDPKTLPHVREHIIVDTQQYAKRQRTFMKKLIKKLSGKPDILAVTCYPESDIQSCNHFLQTFKK